ncbi:MAG: DUF1353 domain-containing protein [Pseudomonadota bacterium]
MPPTTAYTPDYFKPTVPNPYPGSFERITDFVYERRLVLAREPKALVDAEKRGVSYVVAEPYPVRFKVDGVERRLIVPAGMLTDLVSVPRVLRSLVGRVGPHLEAAIVHDYLYVAWQLMEDDEARLDDWRFANEVMYAGLEAAGVGGFLGWSIRTALSRRFISWPVYAGRDGSQFVRLDPRFAAAPEETGLV